MDPQQIVSAIQIAADPTQDRSLQAQAIDFLNGVRANARLQDHCAVALTLFLEQNADGSRKHSSHVRVFALQLLDDYLDNGCVRPSVSFETRLLTWANLVSNRSPQTRSRLLNKPSCSI